MAGYIYHLRPLSNQRFCKIGMTNGRDVESRVKELNSNSYAGFSDWAMVSLALVEDPQDVENSFHRKYSSNKVPMGPEQEVFVVDRYEVEKDFNVHKTVSFEEFLSLKTKFEEMTEKNAMLIKENNALREGDLTRREHRELLKLLQSYKVKFGELDK